MSELNLENLPVVENPEQSIQEGLNEIQKIEIQKIDPSLNEETVNLILEALSEHQELLANEEARQSALEEIVNFIKDKAADYEKIGEMKPELENILVNYLEKAA